MLVLVVVCIDEVFDNVELSECVNVWVCCEEWCFEIVLDLIGVGDVYLLMVMEMGMCGGKVIYVCYMVKFDVVWGCYVVLKVLCEGY